MTATSPIRVGIVGASPARGWALEAHVPALLAHPEFTITAVATRHAESASAAAERFGVPHAFTSARELAEHPEVDVVAVCVKVPDHDAAVLAALHAGKHVYCEWPLSTSAPSAAELAGLAARQGVTTMVGLQGRVAPGIARARELVQEGYVGRLLAASLVGSTPLGGAQLVEVYAFGADVAQGMNVLTVPGGHALDALCFCVGEPQTLSAQAVTQTRRATVIETGEAVSVTAPDQVTLRGSLAGGATLSAHVQGGVPGPADFRIRILGDQGRLELHDSSHIHLGDPVLSGARGTDAPAEIPLDGAASALGLSRPGANLARMYGNFATALRAGEPASPSFADAVTRHRMLDAILAASPSARAVSP